MTRIVFINNQFLPFENASVPIMDRGFLFGDGVYEVAAIINGKLIDNEAHIERLFRSMSEIKIMPNFTKAEIIANQNELINKNNTTEGLIYLQVTRGTAERDFNYAESLTPNLVMFTQVKNILQNQLHKTGVKAVTVPDIRWQRRDIKSTALLAQVLAKNEAKDRGAYEAIMVQNGFVTEGSSSNVFIVKDKKIITKSISNEILSGITRKAILRLAVENNLQIEERNILEAELFSADECFISSASNLIIGITHINNQPIANAAVGGITSQLLRVYIEAAV